MSPPDHKDVIPGWLAGSTALSGFLLAICVFLPAVESCGKPVYPLEMPLTYPPYVFGLVTALVALVRRTPRWLVAIHMIALAAVILLVGFAVHGIAFEKSTVSFARAIPVGLFWPIALLAIRAYWPRRAPSWRVARATASAGALGLLWFALFSGRNALYGIWLSLASSAMLLLAGVVREVWLARSPRPRVKPPTVF